MILALDVGGTKLEGACGERRERVATPAVGDDALDALVALAERVAGSTRVEGVGVSFGGHVDAATGTVVRSLHVPGWEGVPLGGVLRDRFDAPVLVENDANAGALGEWNAAGRPSAPLCYVTVSTGVGGGIVVGGEVFRGVDGRAGEVGHVVVDPDGDPCPCGRRGCVETIASGPAIARHGDYTRAARALAFGISALVSIVDPAFVAIGGGVSQAGPRLWDPLRRELERLRWPDVTTQVRPAAAGDPPLQGAFVLGERARDDHQAIHRKGHG